MLNPGQQKVYRPLVEKAWTAFCERSGISPDDDGTRNAWYRKELVGRFGFYTTKEVPADNVLLFDEICLHFAVLSGDEKEIGYWSSGDERRAMWRLENTMKNAGVGWPYVLAIARNMSFIGGPDNREIKDLPAEHILKLNTAVFIYMKRKAAKVRREELEEAPF